MTSKRKSTTQSAEMIMLLGDCTKELKNIPEGSVQLVFSSPPYNIGKEYETSRTLDEYLCFQTDVLRELARVMSNTGVICWQVGNYVKSGTIRPLDLEFEPLFAQYGFSLRRRLVWSFGHGLHCTKRLSGRYETISVFSRLPPTENVTDNEALEAEWRSGVISSAPNVKSNHVEKLPHPCQFPIELAERVVLKYSREGDVVLDPFAGVGTTGLAALMHHRRAVCIEIDDDYMSAAKQRIAALNAGTLKRRVLGTAVHVPTDRDSVARRPAEFNNVVNESLAVEASYRLPLSTSLLSEQSCADLLLVESSNIVSLPPSVVDSCRNVCVVVHSVQTEQYVYNRCVYTWNLTMMNRIVSSHRDRFFTIMWFVKDTHDYHFDLDAIRVPSKYPGKRSATTQQFSGNPLGKNPSDIWPADDTGAIMFGISEDCLRRVIRAFCGVGGYVAINSRDDEHSKFVCSLKRNVFLFDCN